jgi:hypothetical protein
MSKQQGERLVERLREMVRDCQSGQRTSKSDRWALTLERAAAYIEQLTRHSCDTCKWWRSPESLRGWEAARSAPGAPGECALMDGRDDLDGVPHQESKAIAICGGHEPGQPVVSTAPDFWCVQWESKTKGKE